MKIERRFTKPGQSPYAGMPFVERSSEIRNPDGSTVFKLGNIRVPEQWTQLAVDILAQKYFRKAGVPQVTDDGAPCVDADGNPLLGGEHDARQIFHRLAGCWTYWGKAHGYFTTDEDAGALALRMNRYKLIDGHVWPLRIDLLSDHGQVTLLLDDVSINGQISEGAFQPPRRAIRRR